MRIPLLLVLAVLAHSAAFADSILLSDSPSGGTCGNSMQNAVPATVYVLHTSSLGARGSSWRVFKDSVGPAIQVLEFGSSCANVSAQGNPFDGISVDYGTCRTGTFVVCELTYIKFTDNTIPGCNHLTVSPRLGGPPQVISVACDGTEQAATGGVFTFDIVGKTECTDCTTATRRGTWSAVKALYR